MYVCQLRPQVDRYSGEIGEYSLKYLDKYKSTMYISTYVHMYIHARLWQEEVITIRSTKSRYRSTYILGEIGMSTRVGKQNYVGAGLLNRNRRSPRSLIYTRAILTHTHNSIVQLYTQLLHTTHTHCTQTLISICTHGSTGRVGIMTLIPGIEGRFRAALICILLATK